MAMKAYYHCRHTLLSTIETVMARSKGMQLSLKLNHKIVYVTLTHSGAYMYNEQDSEPTSPCIVC